MASALNQYLDLYRAHKDLIFEKSAPGFNRLRDHAYENLKTFGLPAKGSENYEITDLQKMLSPDYGLNIARVPLDVNPLSAFKCGLPRLSSSLFFLLNDRVAETKSAREGLPEGVETGPLSGYLCEESGEEYYGRLADLANPIVALNSLLVQEGLFIRVRKGVKVERPIQLINLLENSMPLMAMRRLLIIMEEDSELKLLSCSHTSSYQLPMASVSVAEIYAGRNSHIDFYDLEESSPTSSRLTALYLRQEEGSEALIESFTLRNGMTRNEYHCEFAARHASLRLYGLGIEGRESTLDNYSHISHNAESCRTEELFKYIVDDEARGAFTGLVYVAPGASKTEAYQSNRNIVGSDRARMYSKPQLEIYNDDVKCSHGSATGQLDMMQLFYLRQRGLDEATARLLLKQAFMADIVAGVRLPALQERLHSLVEKRLSGIDTSCEECKAGADPAGCL